MEKTDNFFVIHNYNTLPLNLLEYCKNYIIYDSSDDEKIKKEIEEHGLNAVHIENTGHNLTSYFQYFVENYNNLPEYINLLKGNMIGRHCTKEFFDRTYANKYFTYLYSDRESIGRENPEVAFTAMENQYLEINNSWYVYSQSHPHRYFKSFNDLLCFVYKEPPLSKYCIFAPGGMYIVSKTQVLKHSKAFYSNLHKIMSYGMNPSFPSEAHQIERMLPIIFQANYEENDWMNDEKLFIEKIEGGGGERAKTEQWEKARTTGLKYKIKKMLRRV